MTVCKTCKKERKIHAKGLCKACYWIQWRDAHPEAMERKRIKDREKARVGRIFNPDKYNERNRVWYHKHKNDPGFREKHRAYARAYWPGYYQRAKRRKILRKIQADKATIHHSVLTGEVKHHRPNDGTPGWRRISRKIFSKPDN